MNRQQTFEVAGRTISYTIHFSHRERHLSLRISPEAGLVFVVPKRLRMMGVNYDALLQAKTLWVIRKLDKLAKTQNQRLRFSDGSTLLLCGKEITLRIIQTSGDRASARREGDVLLVLAPGSGESYIRDVVAAWYKHSAKKIITKRVEELNAPLGFPWKKVVVRNQRSRWGSCSRRGTLSFNWRLLLLPSSVMEYLIYHELAHLKEMNHSIRFWRLVQTLCPMYREEEHWLKMNSQKMFW